MSVAAGKQEVTSGWDGIIAELPWTPKGAYFMAVQAGLTEGLRVVGGAFGSNAWSYGVASVDGTQMAIGGTCGPCNNILETLARRGCGGRATWFDRVIGLSRDGSTSISGDILSIISWDDCGWTFDFTVGEDFLVYWIAFGGDTLEAQAAFASMPDDGTGGSITGLDFDPTDNPSAAIILDSLGSFDDDQMVASLGFYDGASQAASGLWQVALDYPAYADGDSGIVSIYPGTTPGSPVYSMAATGFTSDGIDFAESGALGFTRDVLALILSDPDGEFSVGSEDWDDFAKTGLAGKPDAVMFHGFVTKDSAGTDTFTGTNHTSSGQLAAGILARQQGRPARYSVAFPDPGAPSAASIIGRFDEVNGYLYVGLTNPVSGTASVFRFGPSGFALVCSASALAFSVGDIISLFANGTTIGMKQNGSVICSGTDADITAAGKWGYAGGLSADGAAESALIGAVGAMSTIDTFNRANSAHVGGSWTETAGTPAVRIASNRAVAVGGGGGIFWSPVTADDQEFGVELAPQPVITVTPAVPALLGLCQTEGCGGGFDTNQIRWTFTDSITEGHVLECQDVFASHTNDSRIIAAFTGDGFTDDATLALTSKFGYLTLKTSEPTTPNPCSSPAPAIIRYV